VTGLRAWDRDATLPSSGGQPELTPPTRDEVRTLVNERLLETGAPAVDGVSWEYARWKPGVSTTCVFRIYLLDGSERLVATKLYADEKARALAERSFRDRGEGASCHPLQPRAFLPERKLAIWCDVADRELPGQAFVLDARKLSRLVEEAGFAGPRMISRSRVHPTTLRFKPERRAVWRVDLALRDGDYTRRSLAARVMPPDEAHRVADARQRLPESAPVPKLIAAERERGVLLEEWLDVGQPAPDDFGHAADAGELLALLHRTPVPDDAPARPRADAGGALALFEPWPALAELARAIPAAEDGPPVAWTHGDFHPDQVVPRQDASGHALLDLDRIAAGDPARDLASWIADAFVDGGALDLDAAGGDLRAGYLAGGGAWPDAEHLRHLVADELRGRAAAALRRLEVGAVSKARRCLVLATTLVESGVSR
jgi:hypothetical protein